MNVSLRKNLIVQKQVPNVKYNIIIMLGTTGKTLMIYIPL